MTSSTIARNITRVKARINAAEQSADRSIGSVGLLAVSKTRSAHDIEQALAAGVTHVGENYLQEALPKIQQLSGQNIVWHFIGPIQSNKTRDIAEHFDWVESVDREKIARRLSEQRPDHLSNLHICLQVNIDNQDTKSGVSPERVHALADYVSTLPRLTLRGLMCIPSPENSEAAFKAMRALFLELSQQHTDLDTLSMGMSRDFEDAIAFGSTRVRIGSEIFGARN